MSQVVLHNPRRERVVSLVVCVLGSAAALFAATRTWAVTVQRQADPLPDLHISHAGTSAVPLLSALALVGLAGSAALLATRGLFRVVVGGLVTGAGVGVVVCGSYGLATLDGVQVAWPVVCMPAGLLMVAGGVLAVRRAQSWPAMGARYDRPASFASFTAIGPEEDRVPPIGPPPSDVAMWDALDRGEDPTGRGE
ncbi:MAG: Trp biosynthesis-associated membrane protein [Micromonosporaceae bacterium]|nr:Trp biosynthesis-associated membrane protein [Micromonosporaceae bacterium]